MSGQSENMILQASSFSGGPRPHGHGLSDLRRKRAISIVPVGINYSLVRVKTRGTSSTFSYDGHGLSHSLRNRTTSIVSVGVNYSFLRGKTKTSSAIFSCLSFGLNEIAEITHNKVLMAAAVSAAVGQMLKPFTSSIHHDNRNNFNFKAVLQAGGFPSTHSSAAVATATSIGLERGLSDAIFGLAVVYASLVMYDAQGVRREVGIHAKALNRVLHQNSVPSNDADDLINSRPQKSFSNPESFEPLLSKEANSLKPIQMNAKLLLRTENRKSDMQISSNLASDVEGESEKALNSSALQNESVGHNEIEVIAGALLGLLASLAVYAVT